MEQTDVAIVGGGPGGAAAGWAVARQGGDAVIIEKGVPRSDREELGPDSTDAGGMLNYWVDLMGLPESIPEDVILQDLEGATWAGPTEQVTFRDTKIARTSSMSSSYPTFGFTYHRARFDDWLRERAKDAGASYRVGTGVTDIALDRRNRHTVQLHDGSEISARTLILADGPQRPVTKDVLKQIVSEDQLKSLALNQSNHIAYQEYRKFPPELFDESLIRFWWGVIPGHTAYPWVFPNNENIARVGLTMPIDLDLSDVRNRDAYQLLRPDDTAVPRGSEYIQRLLTTYYPAYDVESDFPLVEDRGKRGGIESYPISSTRPIDSPTQANVAIVGGAMGATSAFHEGGYHVAVGTGTLAGKLAGAGKLSEYNRAWKRTVGEEIHRNVAMADVVREFDPDDWDYLFRSLRRVLKNGYYSPLRAPLVGTSGLSVLVRFLRTKFSYRNGSYVQLTEPEYTV